MAGPIRWKGMLLLQRRSESDEGGVGVETGSIAHVMRRVLRRQEPTFGSGLRAFGVKDIGVVDVQIDGTHVPSWLETVDLRQVDLDTVPLGECIPIGAFVLPDGEPERSIVSDSITGASNGEHGSRSLKP